MSTVGVDSSARSSNRRVARYRSDRLEGRVGAVALLLWLIVFLPLDAGRLQSLAESIGLATAYFVWLVVPLVALFLAIASSRWSVGDLMRLWWRLRGLWLALIVAQAVLLVAPWWWAAWIEGGLPTAAGATPSGWGVMVLLLGEAMVESTIPVMGVMLAAGWAAWWVQGRPIRVVLLGLTAPACCVARVPLGRSLASSWLRFGLRVALVLERFSGGRSAVQVSVEGAPGRSPWKALVRGWAMAVRGRLPDGTAIDDDPRAARVVDLVLMSRVLDAAGPSGVSCRCEHFQYRAWRQLDEDPRPTGTKSGGARPTHREGRGWGLVILGAMLAAQASAQILLV